MTDLTRAVKLNKMQDDASTAWINSGGRGTLELATGTGKTMTFFKCLYKAKEKKWIKKKDSVLFLAEVTDREQTIRDDAAKFKQLFKLDVLSDFNFEFACYQSAYKWQNKNWKIVGADEVHGDDGPGHGLCHKPEQEAFSAPGHPPLKRARGNLRS